jgi:hypothetical protein
MTGTNFSSWYRQDEGTFVVTAATAQATSGYATAWRVDDGTDSNRMMSRGAGSNLQDFRVLASGSSVVNLEIGNTKTANVFFTHAAAYKVNDFASAWNGSNLLSDTSGAVPTVTRLGIGYDPTSAIHQNGHIRSLRYYPQRLTDAQLQTLTQS